jgi:hypothetical protein
MDAFDMTDVEADEITLMDAPDDDLDQPGDEDCLPSAVEGEGELEDGNRPVWSGFMDTEGDSDEDDDPEQL